MYTVLDVVKAAERLAESVILRDRLRYKPFFVVAERFAAEHGLIVGGEAATRLLLRGPGDGPVTDPDAFRYDFYSGRAAQHARELGDLMWKTAPEGLGHYTTVLAKVAGYHYSVVVDGRDLFTVTALPVHRGVRTADVVIPSMRPAMFADENLASDSRPKLSCMGPDLQLMRSYTALCDPAGDWSQHLETESALRQIFATEIRGKIAEAVRRVEGGATGQSRSLLDALRSEYIAGPGRVLVGPAAVRALTGKDATRVRLQVVALDPLEREAEVVARIAARLKVDVRWTINDPRIPTDTRLRRMTVAVVEGSRQEPILDVFNAAEHELIPYTVESKTGGDDDGVTSDSIGNTDDEADAVTGGRGRRRAPASGPVGATLPANTKIGTPYAIMRFRLADMWTIQVLMHMGAINAGFGRGVLHEMLDDFLATAAYCSATTEPARLLPLTSYIGRHESSDLALKRAAQEKVTRFQPPYLPAAKKSSD